jgi:hypothetical protein
MEYQNTDEAATGESQASKAEFDKEKVMEFYKKGLPAIFKTLFKDPVNGIYHLLLAPGDTSFINSVFLMVTTVLLYIILPYFMLGEYSDLAGGFSLTIKLGIMIALFMFIISVVSFGIKSISGKPVFKNELLTGALCGVPLSIFIVFVFVIRLFVDLNPVSLVMGYMQGGGSSGFLITIVGLYVFLMLVTILQQSLRAGSIREVRAWYLAPVGILVAFYVAQRLGIALMG